MAVKICRRTGKIGYRSLGEARAALKEIESERQSLWRQYEQAKNEKSAYKCRLCPRWHLTSQYAWGDSAVDLRARPS